ncbi:HAD-IA family hydrolase, partial [Acinetobacter baumannii]
MPPETLTWISRAKSMDFSLCVLSNTRKPDRLVKLCGQMGLEFIRDRFKPSPRMFLLALERHKLSAEQAVMIGDQLMTDVLGANRAGIDAIWV